MIKRKIYNELLKEKNNNKISILLGSRQVGKTTILKELHDTLKGLFLDLDILENFEKVNTYNLLINTLKLEGYKEDQKEIFYLFLDEFQRYEDLSKIMKNIYDNHKNIKIYATGSSSLKIKEQVQESLAGRKFIHYLYPLDFEEFLWFKEDNKSTEELKKISNLEGNNLKFENIKKLLYEYLIYGGYPEVVLTGDFNEKKEILRSIFDLFVKKDLVNYLKIGKILGVKKLIEYLAVNNGRKIKYDEAADRCLLKQYEVKEYIEILKESYLIHMIRPFFSNKNKEIVKIPKVYFLDNGVRNYFVNNFNNINIREDSGFLFESFVFQEMLKSNIDEIKFWEDKQKHEVDFIIDLVSRQIPLEVKFKPKLNKKGLTGLNAFLKNYKIKKAFLINLGIQKKDKKIIYRLPFNLEKLNLRG